MKAFSWSFSIGHHLGLTSMPQVMHTLSPLLAVLEESSPELSIEEALWAPWALLELAVVDARLFDPAGSADTGVLVAIAIRFAFRTVPVRVRSACLKFCT